MGARLLGWGLLGCVCLTMGCSSTTFFYNRLDFILPWYVNDYADLNREQNNYLDELLDSFLQWHRTRELPCYLVLLDEVEGTLAQKLTPEDIAELSLTFERAWYRVEGEALARQPVALLGCGEDRAPNAPPSSSPVPLPQWQVRRRPFRIGASSQGDRARRRRRLGRPIRHPEKGRG